MSPLKKLTKKSKIQIVLLSLVIFIMIIGTIISAAVLGVLKDVPKTNLTNLSRTFNQTSSIYDENGKLLEKIESLEYRTIVPISKVPTNIQNAFVAIEDQRFYKHKGVDLRGILGALKDNIAAGSIVRGGSTITQQLVKNVYLSNVKSLNRKIQEAYLAFRVENTLSKKDILEAYLNRINLGQGAYGVEAAAQTYFSKDVWDLNLAQCALLAGITKSPAEYSPFKRIPKDLYKNEPVLAIRDVNGEQMYIIVNDKSFKRQKIVLAKMLQLGYINKKQYEDALKFDTVKSLKPGIKKYHNMGSYSTDYIKSEAARLLANYYKVSPDEAEHKLFTGGYRIYSSIDEPMQKYLENLYTDLPEILNAQANNSKGANNLSISIDNNKNIVDKNGGVIYFYRYNFFDKDFNLNIDKNNYNINSKGDLAINKSLFKNINNKLDLIDLYEINDNNNLVTYNLGFINIPKNSFVERKDYIIIDHNYLKKHKNFYSIDGDNLKISKDYYSYDENPVIQPESSTVILDNKTGYVKAIVGGLDTKNKNAKILNRATSSPRSPGSLIEPLSVYLPSLENGKTLGSVVDDVPLVENGVIYPYNFYDGFKGLLTMRYSLENNSNTASVQFLKELGYKKSMESLEKLGIINKNPSEDNFVNTKENSSHNDENIDALALGNMQKGVTNIDIASAYRAIASGGNYKKASAVIKIEDSSGITIIDNEKPDKEHIFNKDNCYLLTDAMRTNVTKGSAKGATIYNFDIAGVVGKNKYNSDLWFTGYSPEYTISTWIGADSPKIELNAADSIVINLFKRIALNTHKGLDPEKFKAPKTITEKYICEKNGKLGTLLCEEANAGYLEKYIVGTEPKKYCTHHKKALICNVSNRLAGEYCPKESVEYRIYYDRSDYNPKEHNNIYPDDYERVPKLYCNIHDEEWYNKEKENKKEVKKDKKSKSAKTSKKDSKGESSKTKSQTKETKVVKGKKKGK